ncbi:ethanolamine ammonia-lyase subunit EutB [Roseivirga pacifica]|uniref:ethanolamine ammonia-lyase subunit EutB n=1 Tax=Roseivirga pacifica TaxID=1267423 RepID=UPI0020957C58|nr:ethanolamine ammonia-lyase subunit EutB [Roseivirga pacifica]MCO6357924.1 ethanolamine ammonia-lyase subunit EutB [Roseivirga pacifica]MCO6366363.1 ethanolamine ammonia-lyase subunit EutB [Roseivirga pacifica]MCO6370848.1 ethanolamine ammonia-lyase subunit EutB [Roseivirga pacifica]MCO6373656.1 ethanolamine ammonia-lyase subunit EutB [Roseivirga pacifica]MCO6380637.1 ethanolamine ammonia-lyase subunit EutB [Roseivirga pacifica]
MNEISRKEFITKTSLFGASLFLINGCDIWSESENPIAVQLSKPKVNEDIFGYINRVNGQMDLKLYRQILGAANDFKEGDLTLGIAAKDEASRAYARKLLSQTKLKNIDENIIYKDGIQELIQQTTTANSKIEQWTMGELKQYVLEKPESDIKVIMPSLSSDVIACLVKLLSNEELIAVGQKVFNPLPNSQIGAKGYMSARIQPNSPTDNVEDITWQVFNAWSYGVGDLLLGTNPVSSNPESVAKIEAALFDILTTFGLEETMPNCVLSHIDIQAEVEEIQPGTTGIWFQSLAGTENANKTFDLTIKKMFDHVKQRNGRYGLYAETGQGADFTNGHGEGFDMVIHEARKYGFVRALKAEMAAEKPHNETPWVFVNDVAGFIGPEVFRTKEQLVRCCLEDTVMGKLHGLTIGLDICSTLHMDVSLDDLAWCIDEVMPANPAYLMALPTKNDPMLSYLTTGFNDHVRVREKFGYKVNDAMWDFFKYMEIFDEEGKPTKHFGDPTWMYYQYRKAKNDSRSQAEIYAEGKDTIKRINDRGVPIAEGYGENIWDLNAALDEKIHRLYEDSKVSLWTEMPDAFAAGIPAATNIITASKDRKDYVYHPESGEKLTEKAIQKLEAISAKWPSSPDVQIVISDGLNARALMDEGHLTPFLQGLKASLTESGYSLSDENIVIRHGRVRAGYKCGEVLFGTIANTNVTKGIIHIIGERPGSGHHNFSAYLTAATVATWKKTGTVDHNISRVVSGISDTSLTPQQAVIDTVKNFNELYLSAKLLSPS